MKKVLSLFVAGFMLVSCSTKEVQPEPVKPRETVVVHENFLNQYLQSVASGGDMDDNDEDPSRGPIIVIMCKCGGKVVHPNKCNDLCI